MVQSLRFRFLVLAAGVLALSGALTPARAQDPDDLQRGVARISLINGDVSVRRGDSGDWVAGVINAPLLADDHISTAPNSRAEVQFDSANVLRIGGMTELRLAQLEAGRFQMELARGTVTFRVLRPTNANVEVDTPNVSIRPSKQGSYRITVNEGGETEIAARLGDIEIFTPRGTQAIAAGQMMIARGTPDNPEFQIVGAPPADEWDRWNDTRDHTLLQSNSYQYVGPGVYGAEDLDTYGQWTDVAPYGQVWHPTAVGADWAPYQSGRWVWEDWYGWTWVSYDPWGWAPYHYGRWFYQAGFGWCWYPGLRGVRHYWSPALVGFFGFGGGVGFGVGFGNIGWVPLAPYEVFHPWWGRGYYGRNAFERNFTGINVVSTYRNARYTNAVTSVSSVDFRAGRFGNVTRMSGTQVGQAGMIRGQVPVTPSNANLHFSNRAVSYTPRSSGSTQFFRQQQPNGAPRMTFGGAAPSSGAAGSPGGWRRFGEPTTPNNFQNSRPPSASQAAPQGRNGWQRFGEPGASSGANAPRNNAPASPGYNAPRQSAPSYSPPPRQSAPSYSAPPRQSAPSYSTPRGGGGAAGGGRPSGGGGGSSRGHR